MKYPLQIDGFEGQNIELDPPGFLKGAAILVNGNPAGVSRRLCKWENNRFHFFLPSAVFRPAWAVTGVKGKAQRPLRPVTAPGYNAGSGEQENVRLGSDLQIGWLTG